MAEGNPTGLLEMDGAAVLSPKTFDRIRRLVYDTAGIDLRSGKEQLVSARLGKKLRENSCRTYEEYLSGVESDRTGESLIALIDALTTNYTSFLRETAHFDFLRQVILPKLCERDVIDVWCAASATGEEPYSLIFTMLDALRGNLRTQCRLLATDISTRALKAAQKGVYPAERFAACPQEWLPRYLMRGDGAFKGLYQVKPEVARRIEFRRLNLIEAFSVTRKFPLISCRNVLIYFDKPTQEHVINRLASFLEPDGYLFVGHSESLAGIKHPLKFVKPAIYQNVRPATARGGEF
jgi:chemotaxis protein methyltransferase CheR